MGDLGNFIVNCLRVVIDGGRLGMDVNKQVQNTNTRIFMSQIDRWFGEGIELLELGLEDDDGVREEVQDPTTSSAWNLDTLNIHLVDNWRSISRLSLATARPKFQASRFFARIVVLNKRSYNNDQLFAIKVRILQYRATHTSGHQGALRFDLRMGGRHHQKYDTREMNGHKHARLIVNTSDSWGSEVKQRGFVI